MSQNYSRFDAFQRQLKREIDEEKRKIKQLKKEIAIRSKRASKSVRDLKVSEFFFVSL